MAAAAKREPVDYGVPSPGAIRFLTIPLEQCNTWYFQDINARDRTLTQWLQLINVWNSGSLPEKYNTPLESRNPFTSRRSAAVFLTDLLARELRLRWIARKFVARLRERIYDRRVVGQDCDLFTTEPVPPHARVYVRDRLTRTKYCFHSRTATQLITSSLAYSQYGIASPQAPKNPYSNRAWTPAQLMVLTSQICAQSFLSMRNFLPVAILRFRCSGYCVEKYLQKHSNELMVAGALTFFKDVRNPDLMETCGNLFDDLYDVLGCDVCVGWRVVKTLALARLFPPEFMSRWDKVLMAVWIHTNFHKCFGFRSHDSMLTEFADLHYESYRWWVAQPKTLLRRVMATAAESDEDSGPDSE